MNDIRSALMGWRNFSSKEEIKQLITKSVNFDPQIENPVTAKTLLFFQSPKQKTWLVATPHRLYCILDDIRKDEPHINWSLSKSKIISHNTLTLEIRSHSPSTATGRIDFGNSHKFWLYSKHIFEDRGVDVENSIRTFLEDAMLRER